MTVASQPLSEQEHRAIICLCILAAFADGAQDEVERGQIQRIVNGFDEAGLDLMSMYQDTLAGKVSPAKLAEQLQTSSARALAYEMALGVCHADGALNESERQFLAALRQQLLLDPASVAAHERTADALVEQPLAASAIPPVLDTAREADLDRMILKAAILNGALEIMPQTLGTMAIIPLQIRLVYQVGKRYGYELDHGHIKDFLATLGVGLSSQVVEGYARRLIGGLTRSVGGRLIGGLAGQAVSSAFGFAITYAIGQVARRYYAGGRTLNTAQLKDVFTSMLQEGRNLQARYSGEIAQKASQTTVAEVLPLLNPKAGV